MSLEKQSTVDVLDEDGVVLNPAESRAKPSKSRKPTPRGGWGMRRTIHLHTLDDVRVEMGRVYRAMASGALAISDGTKLTYSLSLISKTIEASEIERRIAALEDSALTPPLLMSGEPEGTKS